MQGVDMEKISVMEDQEESLYLMAKQMYSKSI